MTLTSGISISRQLLRRLGYDLIRFPSRALHEAIQQLEYLSIVNEQLRDENERLKAELSRKYYQPKYDYDEDGLRVWAKSLDFLADARFRRSYNHGMDSGHKIQRAKGSREDIGIRYRVYTCCWAANYARSLPGDFIECGVNTGIVSLAVCDYIDFNSLGKKFYLFDTFCGIPIEQAAEEEVKHASYLNSEYYEECFEIARRNFAAYPNAVLVRGTVPQSLETVDVKEVAYLHIDMNIALPEVAALTYFWDRLVAGAIVVLDDYGWALNRPQKEAMDEFARSKGIEIYTAPTGQGLIIKR